MQHTIIDHGFAILLALIAPFWGRWGYHKLRRAVAQGAADPRVPQYRSTLRTQWSFTVLLLFWWFASGKEWSLLGFSGEPIAPMWIGLGLTILAVGFVLTQNRMVVTSEERQRELQGQFEELRELIPQDQREARWFRALSITAGVCEEIAYRGFLMTYLEGWVGIWGALALSSLIFGFGHFYQGPRGILKTGIVGAVMGLLYLLTGSLWAPMLVHVLVDLSSGEMGRKVLSREPAAATVA